MGLCPWGFLPKEAGAKEIYRPVLGWPQITDVMHEAPPPVVQNWNPRNAGSMSYGLPPHALVGVEEMPHSPSSYGASLFVRRGFKSRWLKHFYNVYIFMGCAISTGPLLLVEMALACSFKLGRYRAVHGRLCSLTNKISLVQAVT
jgi:hypothetical protein